MSFGEPNNPYGQPPQHPQSPGYGFPQQGQPGVPPQGYGFPPAPPVQQPYGGGYAPGAPAQMPGITRAAQIMLGVIALAHAVIAVLYGVALGEWDQAMADAGVSGDEAEAIADLGKGVVVFLLGLATVFAILGVVLLLQYAKGGNGVRVCSIVYGSFAIVTGIVMIAAYGIGLIIIAISILLIVFSAKRATAEWFRRPRY
ncbi:hypothetical protein [Streptomyces chromofuscus]|uniref:Uncharacterized protein n=1 Tax=Streptomyces chromofuscus TaxID=42881 RepID=A0A7M2T1P2_STRCW|nr:hypothetical protein [Streptomyces chromofuscus]QOV42506.1 hypothetical protein IPT68_22065 [Streptomyces chromofuscus]GGT31042.1 hypothetical protein GCM10010254_59530 [Streptomyces chromofuscus]